MNTFDLLLGELLKLKSAFEAHNMPLLVGGGMGLYLRRRFGQEGRQPRYPTAPPVRSTKDLDLFLTGDVVVDAQKMDMLRDVLRELGYEVEVPYFQFVKTIGENERQVKVDLLGSPPPAGDTEKVKVKGPRIRPRESSRIHARLTQEARGIQINPVTINLAQISEGYDIQEPVVHIPSSFNYLILKLHAFRDRHQDENVDYGRHHALDIFTTVISMTEDDWKTAQKHLADESEKFYLQEAIRIRQELFSEPEDLGVIRLRENTSYRQERAEFDRYVPNFLDDLSDLLPAEESI